jgi:hypothetical protein
MTHNANIIGCDRLSIVKVIKGEELRKYPHDVMQNCQEPKIMIQKNLPNVYVNVDSLESNCNCGMYGQIYAIHT